MEPGENTPFYLQENGKNFDPEDLDRVSIAPMLEITDSHFRTFCRLLTTRSTLYTEMINADTILNNPNTQLILGFNPVEAPLILQLGGSDPEKLGRAARIAAGFGYAGVNLNCGCPSPRVTLGCFGASLMTSPELVARCMTAMAESGMPVSVKCRIGVDDNESFEFLRNFVEVVSRDSPTRHFVIHARKALLKGLNPKENRTVPPLKYEVVYRLAEEFPHLQFSLNGGVRSASEGKNVLASARLRGVMIGRAAYENIWQLSAFDSAFFGKKDPGFSRQQVILKYAEYCDRAMALNPMLNLHTMVRPLLSLFIGQKGATVFRRILSEKQYIDQYKTVRGLAAFAVETIGRMNPSGMTEPYVEQRIHGQAPDKKDPAPAPRKANSAEKEKVDDLSEQLAAKDLQELGACSLKPNPPEKVDDQTAAKS